MLRDLYQALSAVRWRQRLTRSISGLVLGATAGAITGLGIEIARLMGSDYTTLTSWSAVAGGGLAGSVIAWLAPISWKQTARLVDQHYKLQDRTITALSFAKRDSQDSLVQLQLADAMDRLKAVEAHEVLPLRAPKSSIGLAVALALLIGLVAVPRQGDSIDPALAELRQVVGEQAVTLEETMLEDMRELVEKHPEPELKELTKELEEMVAELKSPEVDQREALAKISEMQQSLAAALEKLDLQQVDSQLQELAAALEPAESLKSLGRGTQVGQVRQGRSRTREDGSKEPGSQRTRSSGFELEEVQERSERGPAGRTIRSRSRDARRSGKRKRIAMQEWSMQSG